MNTRRDYLEGGSYSPAEASYYSYGSSVPDPTYQLKRRLALLQKMPEEEQQVSPESFQTFLALQSNPEALFTSKMKLPNTPLGSFESFLNNSYG